MITVSDPQRLTMPEVSVYGWVEWLRQADVDVHEFAKEYVDRTAQLGYAPDLHMSAVQFVEERMVA